jgi:prepilin peptidase CpaA
MAPGRGPLVSFPVSHLGLATLLLLLAAASDVWRRRIPNAVNGAIGVAGLLAQAAAGGWVSLGSGLAAGALTIALLWLPWMTGRIGGGDVKLAGAAAVWLGLAALPAYLLLAAVAGGVLGLVSYALSTRAARQAIRANLAASAATVRLPQAPLHGTNGRLSVPYGTAFAVAGLFLLWRGGLW